MTYLAAVLIVIACAAAAAVAAGVIGRLLTVERRQRHHEVGHPVFLQIGVTLSVLLAFVFSEVWGEYNTAAQAINAECASLHGAAMLAAALPNGEGREVNRAIEAYVGAVAKTEWPAMSTRRLSGGAVANFGAVLATAAHLAGAEPGEAATDAQILDLLSQAHASREIRVYQVTSGVPAAMWTVLIVMSLVLVMFVIFAGNEGGGHIVFAAAFTGCTVMVLVVVRMLDYPFEGALAIGNGDFVRVLGDVSALLGNG